MNNWMDIEEIRSSFPILHQKVNGNELIYFDNAATTQKPQSVIDSITDYYSSYNSNIHRGAHFLANKSTEAFEESRIKIAGFINALPEEINFTRGTTEGINLVAQAFGNTVVHEGDEVLVSLLDHHSNFVPWQELCKRRSAHFKVIPLDDHQRWDLSEINNLITDKTKIIAVNAISNSLGNINPVEKIIKRAREVGAYVVIDGAQLMAHKPCNVKELDYDFLSFSGHKMFGPTGIGVLYGKKELLQKMDPYQFGGEMIKSVSVSNTTYNVLPFKFEAGTPNICGAIALGAAIDFISELSLEKIDQHEQSLTAYFTKRSKEIKDLKILGDPENKIAIFSFMIEGVSSFDLGILLDKMGIAVRTGHHCCQPLMESLNIEGTCRASLSVYNSKDEIDRFFEALAKAIEMIK